MKNIELPGLPGVEITLRPSARARRYGLRVSRADGRVTLTLPVRAKERDAIAFAVSQTDWLIKALGQIAPVRQVAFGQMIPFDGVEHLIVPAKLRAPRIEAGQILVPEDPARLALRVQTLFRHIARQRLQTASEQYAAQIGRSFRKITLRDTRSRWGSCSADGSLSYSWRLVMAPPVVLEYVAAHEVAHLAQMNHSPAFWAVVGAICPDYATHRAWLRREGSALHAIRFDTAD
ncbi:zinc metalloprotease [Thioclava sp. SK-1]|nr:zinc metalloprotease [Thioclava sp. SK-1]